MSYQVLARKWRPRNFREMVGQEHVLKALINALDNNRLHHAYLFTGTRGVGKTTIARILAKCLNCERGISAVPCGECPACQDIAGGRFVDLIEVDAASRTRVEDTRELLDNVQYAPTRGRFKIYLIDEVHMLSGHSFNALLKTLEEPPEHVKFLLATTDPQKLPVTILSRCLQFNLKNMNPERIVQHLKTVLEAEQIPHEEAALWLLARSADGSMRDALSLTDQAIGFGSGSVTDADVNAMLGTIDHRLIADLVRHLIAGSGAGVLSAIADFASQSPDYDTALADLIMLLHRIAIAQAVPQALDNTLGDREQILAFAKALPAEDVQLFYQTALLGRRDLHLAPDPRSGFEMILLRMLAFRPQRPADVPDVPDVSTETETETETEVSPAAPAIQPGATPRELSGPEAGISESLTADAVIHENLTAEVEIPGKKPRPAGDAPPPVQDVAAFLEQPAPAMPEPAPPAISTAHPDLALDAATRSGRIPTADGLVPAAIDEVGPDNWLLLYRALGIRGVLQSTAANCILKERSQGQLHFILDQDKGTLYDESHCQRLAEVLSRYFKTSVKVRISVEKLPADAVTPIMDQLSRQRQRREQAMGQLQSDPVVRALQDELGARLLADSLQFKSNEY